MTAEGAALFRPTALVGEGCVCIVLLVAYTVAFFSP
jgi:hypothetical protein